MKSPSLISVLLFGLLVTAAPLRAGFIQGPVRGTVVLADGAHAGDLVAYVHCIAQGIHGGHKADDSSRVIASGEAFSIPWVYRGLSPRNCHLRVFHPRYLGAHRKLSDDFSQQLGTVELETWEVFLNRGPTDPPMHPAYPWP
ncbi:MAG: hypothetical protein OEN50_02595, partial [Deltaproteobacteria bacterium]|nr:hypothetical protein [Deltaproteobacteria bacterium]